MIIQPVFRSVFSPVIQGVLGNPLAPSGPLYNRPDGTSLYNRPDGTSVYNRP